MDLEPEILDRELDAIFLGCATNESGQARIQDLIDACVGKYGDGQSELENILLSRMDPNQSNRYVSRTFFKHEMKDWILSASKNQCGDGGDFGSSSDENLIDDLAFPPPGSSLSTSTPLRPPAISLKKVLARKLFPNEMNCSEFSSNDTAQQSSFRKMIKVLKTRNESLETSLSKTEQKVHSLEIKYRNVREENASLNKKIHSYEFENLRLNSLLTEWQEKCSTLEEQCNKYKLNNDKLAGEKEKVKELQQNLEDLEGVVYNLKEELRKRSSELKEMENWKHLVHHLQIELGEMRESKEAAEKELSALKAEMTFILSNEDRHKTRIVELQFEIQELRRELSDERAFEHLTSFSKKSIDATLEEDHYSYFCGEEARESGISIKSELSDTMLLTNSVPCLLEPRRVSTEDVSVQTVDLSSAPRISTEDASVQTTDLGRTSSIFTEDVSVQTIDLYRTARDFTENVSIQTVDLSRTSSPRICTENACVQTVDLVTSSRVESQGCQTTAVLLSTQESQTVPTSIASRSCQTAPILRRNEYGIITFSTWTQTEPEMPTPLRVRIIQKLCAVLTWLIITLIVILLLMWTANKLKIRPQLRYPRGPPPT